MGTRFCATIEASNHDRVKRLLVENDERGTDFIFRKLHNTPSVGRNSVSQQVVERLSVPRARFEDVAELVRGAKGRILLEAGDLDAGLVWAGQVQGLIHDIPSVRELMEGSFRKLTRSSLTGLPGCEPPSP